MPSNKLSSTTFGTIPHSVARSAEASVSKLRFPLIATPFSDAIGVICRKSGAKTRSGAEIQNQTIRKQLSDPALDGFEGFLTAYSYDDLRKWISTPGGPGMGPDTVQLIVMDDSTHPERSFAQRLAGIEKRLNKIGPLVRAVVRPPVWVEIRDATSLRNLEAHFVSSGQRGLLLRDPTQPYVAGKADLKNQALIRLERWVRSTAVAVGFRFDEAVQRVRAYVMQGDVEFSIILPPLADVALDQEVVIAALPRPKPLPPSLPFYVSSKPKATP